MPPPRLPPVPTDVGRYLSRGLPAPGVINQPPTVVIGQRVGRVEPWKFGLALVALGVVWSILPAGAHWTAALVLILGALLAANADADARGVPRPLESIRL